MKLMFIAVPLILATRGPAQEATEKPAQESAKPETCTVQGVVVAADSDEPLKAASVKLVSNHELFKQVTGPDGHFTFTGLEPGDYLMQASKSGYALGKSYRLETGPGKKSLELKAGEKLDKVQFRLTRAGVITGRVTDANGEPMVGVVMRALAPGMFIGRDYQFGDVGRFALTNDLGEFRIYGLSAGVYYLTANVSKNGEVSNSDARTWFQKLYAPVFYPGVSTTAEARKISVQVGQQIRIDFPLRIPKRLIVSGRVVDPGGKPVKEANVDIRFRFADMALSLDSVGTDASGSFVISGVERGTYMISANFYGPSGDEYWTEQRVDVAGEDISGLQLRLRENVKISGKVFVSVGPAPDFKDLMVALNIDGQMEVGAGFGEIGKGGEFTIERTKPTGYSLDVRYLPAGYYVLSAFFGDQNVLEDGLDLGGKIDPDDLLKVTLSPGAGQIEGVVLQGDDPVDDAIVRVSSEPASPYHIPVSSQWTDAKGHFSFENLSPGSYRVRAYASVADGNDDDDSSSDGANVARIDLSEKESRSVQLKVK